MAAQPLSHENLLLLVDDLLELEVLELIHPQRHRSRHHVHPVYDE